MTRTRVIRYYDWQRHWYRLLDFVQPVWLAFRDSGIGRFVIWFFATFVWFVIRVFSKALVWTLIVGVGVSLLVLSWCFGSAKLLNMKPKR